MQDIEGLQSDINRAVTLFRSFDPVKPIKVISHLDADGISACSILVHMLNSESKKYSISIVTQLNQEKLEELSKEDYDYFFFTDLGSGNLSMIERMLVGKKAIILDHHEVEAHELTSDNVAIVNPHRQGIDGSKTVAGSGVVLLFTKAIDPKYESMAHIAIVGAIGDMQETGGFTGLNQEILALAIKHNKMRVIRGLKCFGQNSRPLYKVLEYSTDPHIPGVSGSESGAINFMVSLGIQPKDEHGWRMMTDLSHEEMQALIAGIVMRRVGQDSPDDVIGNLYQLVDETPDSPIRDAREFTTLLNACGRMDKASLGIGICLGDKDALEKAMKNQNNYRREIVKALNWYADNKGSDKIIDRGRYMIINAEDKVLHTIIGTMASILSKGNEMKPDTYILSMARNPNENQTKISLRVSGNPSKGTDLHAVLAKIIEKTGGETGGHANAAGAVIKTDKEREFIDTAISVLDSVRSSIL
jgi:single-stranded-DNA-specific exonuclease